MAAAAAASRHDEPPLVLDDRTAEEARLLARRDYHAPLAPHALEARGRLSLRSERGCERIQALIPVP